MTLAHPRHIETAKRNQAHREAGTVDQSPEVFRVPAWKYVDEARWQQEMDAVFRRVPLMLAVGGELKKPGDYKAMMALDVPVLIVRGKDGAARAFVNSCSHRGAIVVEEGHGNRNRFSCPYHNWTYDNEGCLVGVTDRAAFGEIDVESMGLTPLPTAERAGLIFAILTPGVPMDIDGWLQGYDEVLEWFNFADWHLITTTEIEGPNWKIAYDGYVDFYHLPFLHKNTFGPQMFRTASYDFWGPHQRVSTPALQSQATEGMATRGDMPDLTTVPIEEWPIDALAGGVYAMFPNISFACGSTGGMISQLWPGPTPDRSRTIQYHFVSHEPTEEERGMSMMSAAFLENVVRNEDYWMGLRVQKSLSTGVQEHVLFGKNEGGGRHYHRWVDRLIDEAGDQVVDIRRGNLASAGD